MIIIAIGRDLIPLREVNLHASYNAITLHRLLSECGRLTCIAISDNVIVLHQSLSQSIDSSNLLDTAECQFL